MRNLQKEKEELMMKVLKRDISILLFIEGLNIYADIYQWSMNSRIFLAVVLILGCYYLVFKKR